MRRLTDNIALSRLLFVYALIALAFLCGVLVGRLRVFPYQQLSATILTGWSIKNALFPVIDQGLVADSRIPLSRLHDSRIVRIDRAGAGNLLFTGGWNQFREYCPEHGCAAVVLARDGHLVHAYPFRPEEFASHLVVDRPHEAWRFGRGLSRSDDIFGIAQMPDGGLIVTVENNLDFPTGEGLARLDRDGHVLWFRRSYVSHWPYVDGERIIVTAGLPQHRDIRLPISRYEKLRLHCDGRYLNDRVRTFDFNGRGLDDVSVLDALLNSPYRSILVQDNIDATDNSNCDFLHINFARTVGPELASTIPGVSPDDFLVSLRNVSAFLIVGAREKTVKYLYTGSFRQQHAVQPLSGSNVVMFDDHGISSNTFPARILTYNLANGAEHDLLDARAIADGTFHPMFEGLVDVSPDRQYLLITSPTAGRAYELRLSDSHLVTKIYNFQDAGSFENAHNGLGIWAALRTTHGVYYAR